MDNKLMDTLKVLYNAFDKLNERYFNGELIQPIITIQKTKGSVMGHFSVGKVWKDKHNVEEEDLAMHEINLDPRYFLRDTVDIIGTLLHEMVHYYNNVCGIKDCSGQNHNKKFKAAAERVDLIVEKGDSVGWGYTNVSDDLRMFIENEIKPDDTVFDYFRWELPEDKSKKKRKKNIFKFTCPECGMEVKSKKGNIIKCGNCDIVLIMENEDEDESEEDFENGEN